MTEYPVAPDEWECLVFIAVAEEGHSVKAAERLARMRRTYTRQAVNGVLSKIEAWAGERLLTKGFNQRLQLTERGQDFLESARRVVAQYEVMRMAADRPRVPTLACLPHHTTFLTQAEERLRDPDTGEEGLRVEYLGQHQRGESEFLRRAVALLIGDAYQLIVGPPVDDESLESHPLYSARLEAMVGKTHGRRTLPIGDLVERYRMMVTPPDTRSRRLLEDAIATSGVDDPGVAVRIAAETYETATSVMRLRNEHRHWNDEKPRVVVVPSDVALAYKDGMEFGGRGAGLFIWVPIVSPAEGGEGELRLDVCVTVKRTDSRRLLRVIQALRESVSSLDASSPHGGLSGAPPEEGSHVPAQTRR
jgi:DNA-binding transcriptional LysR family regulator